MAFTGSFLCTSFKKELLQAIHNMSATGGDTFKLALYTNAAALDNTTTAYTTSGEASGTGYTAGGAILTIASDPLINGTRVYTQFNNLTFLAVTLTARGALIYNSSKANRAVAVLDFGADKVKTGSDLVIQMPVFDAANALIRI